MPAANLPLPLQELIEELSRLPGIGKKTATRLGLHILSTSRDEADALASAIRKVKENIRYCSICANITEHDPCAICADTARNQQQICIVEDATGIMMIENTREYGGVYHVLGGVISPLDGVGPDNLNIKSLIRRLDSVEEVIIALSSSTEGEATSIYLSRLLKSTGIKITRLARGIPLGSTLEFVDELTLGKALKTRSELD
ncbi:MAG: recombination mediator RecR [Calditrichia bacterium]